MLVDQQAPARKEIIAKYQSRIVRTDVNGHFEVRNVSPSKIYLFAEHKVFSNRLYWFVAAEVKRGAQKVDLSGSNLSWPFKAPANR